MNDFLFTIDKTKQDITTHEWYCCIGNEDFLDDNGRPRTKTNNDKTVATKVSRTNSPDQYMIRLSTQNKLFNPVSVFDNEQSSSIIDNTCRPTNRFINVNQTVFDYYIQFLMSKNVAWLNKAEREMI